MPKAEPEDSPTEGRRKQNAAWAKRETELTAKVGALFRTASPRFAVPNEWWRDHIAQALMTVRDGAEARETRRGNDPCGPARKYAGLFLKHAPLAETALRTQVDVAETTTALATINTESTPIAPPESVQRTRLAVRRLQEAVRAVEACRDDLNFKPWPDRDPIRFIAKLAIQAWAFANGGEAPKGKNPTDPLVLFVAGAFAAAGMHVTRETVSAVLRDRRRKDK